MAELVGFGESGCWRKGITAGLRGVAPHRQALDEPAESFSQLANLGSGPRSLYALDWWQLRPAMGEPPPLLRSRRQGHAARASGLRAHSRKGQARRHEQACGVGRGL